jgi:hypothetical protein
MFNDKIILVSSSKEVSLLVRLNILPSGDRVTIDFLNYINSEIINVNYFKYPKIKF